MQNTHSFSVASLKPLVIGRGPVRLEALEVFSSLGMTHMGILLSKKDSYGIAHGQAPELRALPPGCNYHLVQEYRPILESKHEFIQQIIQLCQQHQYNSVFAGYGFLAEDQDLAQAIQESGLYFIGPSAHVSQQAGAKDAAKKMASAVGASVVPGENELLGKAYIMQTLRIQGTQTQINFSETILQDWKALPVEIQAPFNDEYNSAAALIHAAQKWIESELRAGRAHLADEAIIRCALHSMQQIWRDYPHYQLRIKAIHGGGGKGQRVLSPTDDIKTVTDIFHEIWSEVGVNSTLSNKSCVIELNIPLTRHWEIQLVGNGVWCIALGGRDCSLQRFEQKLVEFSLTTENRPEDDPDHAALQALENDAVAFGRAVALDSVSTYEAIVSLEDSQHFFMEMNTRLQVEHRVSELVYSLEFTPEDEPVFKVQSLIHLMCLLALHGPRLPAPKRIIKQPASLEVRINAMNNALKPSVGGLIQTWSPPAAEEIRDDQGLSRAHPDTGMPMNYLVSGAYDSNLALSLVTGSSRQDCIERMIQVLGAMRLHGRELETNIPVLIGILAVLKQTSTTVLSTQWILGYLDLAATIQSILASEWMKKLNPHRVIAWYLTEDENLLWNRPGEFSRHQLQSLRQVCLETVFSLEDSSVTKDGVLQGPVPPNQADLLLDPPPVLDDFTIRAPSGGIYYAQPAPGVTPFIQPGQKVKKGDTLCIIEAMKMFNPVLAPMDMTIEEVFLNNGAHVKKKEPLVKFVVS